MRHGELIKQLRRNRHLTQAELCDGISNRSTLNSLEEKGAQVSFDRVYQYCERMNVTLDEYQFLYENAVLSSKRKTAKFVRQNFQAPFDPAILDKLQKQYLSTHDFFYYSLYAQYLLIQKFVCHTPALHHAAADSDVQQIADTIRHYLDAIDTWGRFELVLFGNCLFLFSDEYIRFNYQETIAHMKIFNDTANYSTDLRTFLLNGLQLSYERNCTVNYQMFSEELLAVGETYRDTKINLVTTIFDLLTKNRRGVNVTRQLAQLDTALALLGESDWQAYVHDEITKKAM